MQRDYFAIAMSRIGSFANQWRRQATPYVIDVIAYNSADTGGGYRFMHGRRSMIIGGVRKEFQRMLLAEAFSE